MAMVPARVHRLLRTALPPHSLPSVLSTSVSQAKVTPGCQLQASPGRYARKEHHTPYPQSGQFPVHSTTNPAPLLVPPRRCLRALSACLPGTAQRPPPLALQRVDLTRHSGTVHPRDRETERGCATRSSLSFLSFLSSSSYPANKQTQDAPHRSNIMTLNFRAQPPNASSRQLESNFQHNSHTLRQPLCFAP